MPPPTRTTRAVRSEAKPVILLFGQEVAVGRLLRRPQRTLHLLADRREVVGLLLLLNGLVDGVPGGRGCGGLPGGCLPGGCRPRGCRPGGRRRTGGGRPRGRLPHRLGGLHALTAAPGPLPPAPPAAAAAVAGLPRLIALLCAGR